MERESMLLCLVVFILKWLASNFWAIYCMIVVGQLLCQMLILRHLEQLSLFCLVQTLKKPRQAHQVTVCVLFDLLMSAFENCHNENAVESIYIDFDTFLAWCSEQKIKKNILNFGILS